MKKKKLSRKEQRKIEQRWHTGNGKFIVTAVTVGILTIFIMAIMGVNILP